MKTINNLKLWKNRPWICLVVAEIILLLVLLSIGWFRQNEVYHYDADIFYRNDEGNFCSYEITIPRGIYRVVLEYECTRDLQSFCNIVEAEERDKLLLCSGEHLSNGLGKSNFDLWIKGNKVQAVVQIIDGGDNVVLNKLSIYQTDRDITRNICILLMLSLFINGCYIFKKYDEVYHINKQKKVILFGLLFTIMISSIPLLVDFIYSGSDTTYHLLRIGNIKDGLLSGQFPVRIDPSWLWGHGYASSICYGETLLYIPAFLRLIGFTLQGSYLLFLFFLNIGTCLVTYYSFKRIFKNIEIGLLCSALYTLSLYRLYKMYSWNALGEVQGMLFLPIILFAVYEIFTEDIKTNNYKRKWIPLAIGFSGIIQCHVLTCELTVIFLALACVILWKRLFRKETILVFVKGVIGTCLLSAWFLVPFLDYMINVDMIIHHVSARTIQEVGIYPAQLFFTFFRRGGTREFFTNGLLNAEATGVGMPITAAAVILLLLWVFGCLKEKNNLIIGSKIAGALGILAMIMSLSLFPWTKIQFINQITASLISSIQYPNRFLMIATLLLVMVAGAITFWINEKKGKKFYYFYQFCFSMIAIITSLFYMSSIVLDTQPIRLYDEKGMGTGYLSGAEYLRYGADALEYHYHDPIPSEGVKVTGYHKEAMNIESYVSNKKADEGYIDFPLQNYKGYIAETENGERLLISDGENFDIRVMIPEFFSGLVRIKFQPLWYWRVADMISVCAVMVLGIIWLRNKKHCSKSL